MVIPSVLMVIPLMVIPFVFQMYRHSQFRQRYHHSVSVKGSTFERSYLWSQWSHLSMVVPFNLRLSILSIFRPSLTFAHRWRGGIVGAPQLFAVPHSFARLIVSCGELLAVPHRLPVAIVVVPPLFPGANRFWGLIIGVPQLLPVAYHWCAPTIPRLGCPNSG